MEVYALVQNGTVQGSLVLDLGEAQEALANREGNPMMFGTGWSIIALTRGEDPPQTPQP